MYRHRVLLNSCINIVLRFCHCFYSDYKYACMRLQMVKFQLQWMVIYISHIYFIEQNSIRVGHKFKCITTEIKFSLIWQNCNDFSLHFNVHFNGECVFVSMYVQCILHAPGSFAYFPYTIHVVWTWLKRTRSFCISFHKTLFLETSSIQS